MASAEKIFQSGRLWSPREIMINFHVFTLCQILKHLSEIEEDFHARIIVTDATLKSGGGLERLQNENIPHAVSDTDRRRIDGIMPLIVKYADKLENQAIHDRIGFFKSRFVQPPVSIHDFFAEVRTLRETIEKTLQFKRFYIYPDAKAKLLLQAEAEWRPVFSAFPSCKEEVIAAVDCYALGHATASVFHSMRIAEWGLRAVAKERRLSLPRNKPVEWANWQEIIHALDQEIKIIGSMKPGKAKDAALEFYSGARADLNGFKDEYRNLVSHVRAVYNELHALRALRTVHSFMARLSSRMDYRHHRIRWGFR